MHVFNKQYEWAIWPQEPQISGENIVMQTYWRKFQI